MKCNKLLPVLPLIIGCGLLAGIVFIAFAASNQPDDWLTKYQKQLEKEALDLACQFADFRKSVQPVEIDVRLSNLWQRKTDEKTEQGAFTEARNDVITRGYAPCKKRNPW